MFPTGETPAWWTEDDDEYLLSRYEGSCSRELAGEMGVTRQFVVDRHAWLKRQPRRAGKEDRHVG